MVFKLFNKFQQKPTFKRQNAEKNYFCCDYVIEGEFFRFRDWH